MRTRKKLLVLFVAFSSGLLTGKLVTSIARAQGTEDNVLFACFLISVMVGLALYLINRRWWSKSGVKRT